MSESEVPPTTTAPMPPLTLRRIWREPMEHSPRPLDRVIGRLLLSAFRSWLIEVRGIERVMPEHDPFIVALNHNQRLESLLIPTLMIHKRNGRLIHFLSDWVFFLIPLVGSYYRRSEAIVVTAKSARPKILNRLKPLFKQDRPAYDRALAALREGRPVGVFPEGRMNRDPRQLLRGSPSAARLSLESGAPIVPVGIRFPRHDSELPIGDMERMVVEFGAPLVPPAPPSDGSRAPSSAVMDWHAELMGTLARLSGKKWPPR